MNKRCALLVSLCSISLTACSTKQLVDFSIIQQSNQCHIPAQAISLLSSERQQTEFIEKFSLFKAPEASQELNALFTHHTDFETLFIVSQGSKPTAGYGFNVHGNQAELFNNTLLFPIKFTSPNQDAYLAQVMTSPCLVLGVDSSADYNAVVIDHLELTLPQ